MTDFVGVKIALIHNGKLLMIQRDDKPGLRYAGLWDFAGGAREGEEAPEKCMIREVEEELHITVKSDQILWKKVHPAMHNENLNAYFMVAKISDADMRSIIFGAEGQGWKMFGIDDFLNSDEVVEPLKGRLQLFLEAQNNQ